MVSSNLEKANLTGANLTGAIMVGVDLSGADLTKATMVGADIKDTIFTNVEMNKTNISGLVFTPENQLSLIRPNTIIQGTMGIEGVPVLDGRVHEIQIREGEGYEVHNAYSKLMSKRRDILDIISSRDYDPGIELTPYIISMFGEYFISKNGSPAYQKEQFDNLREIEEALVINDNINGGPDGEYKELIYESVRFALSQDDLFKDEYVKIFMDETCNAYGSERERLSCVKGILERLVISIGATVQVLCSENITCGDNYLYVKLNNVFNTNPKEFFTENKSEILSALYEEYVDKYSELKEKHGIISNKIRKTYKKEIIYKITEWAKRQVYLVKNPEDGIEDRKVLDNISPLIRNTANDLISTIINTTIGGKRKISRSTRHSKSGKKSKSKKMYLYKRKTKKTLKLSKTLKKSIKYKKSRKSRKVR